MMVRLTIDDQKIMAKPGRRLLSVCLEAGIYIPHLCHLEQALAPAAACRLCFVEIEGIPAPLPACTLAVEAALRVRTDTPAVRRLQRTALRLLLSMHPLDCKNCPANRGCELQTIARFLGIGLRSRPLMPIERPQVVASHHPLIDHYPHRCVLCGKCVRVCQQETQRSMLTLAGRGIDTTVRHYPDADEADTRCADCRRCIEICPVKALRWLCHAVESDGENKASDNG